MKALLNNNVLGLIILLGLTSFIVINKGDQNMVDKWIPSQGFVPNEFVARQIAEAVLLPIYGEGVLEQKPFNVRLIKDSIWGVEGVQKEVSIGGVAYIEIQKSDCKILKVTHGK